MYRWEAAANVSADLIGLLRPHLRLADIIQGAILILAVAVDGYERNGPDGDSQHRSSTDYPGADVCCAHGAVTARVPDLFDFTSRLAFSLPVVFLLALDVQAISPYYVNITVGLLLLAAVHIDRLRGGDAYE
jgi:hypothetical protein